MARCWIFNLRKLKSKLLILLLKVNVALDCCQIMFGFGTVENLLCIAKTVRLAVAGVLNSSLAVMLGVYKAI